MSKEIEITIVSENEKLNNTVDDSANKSVIVTHDSSMTIMSTLLKNHLISGSFCGGRGDCGRCRIQFLKGATIPTAIERSVMEAEELRQGFRLACLAKPKEDCTVRLALTDASKIAIVSNMMDVTDIVDSNSQSNRKTENRKLNVMKSADGNVAENEKAIKETDVMIAVDLGTTTIAMQLMTMNTGRVIDTYCEMNPQRRYGADVLSRIQASCEGNREILQGLVIEVLERGVARFRKQTMTVQCMCIAGNTTMEHLLMGYDVSSLGKSPFTPVEIGLQVYRHSGWDFTVWLVPGISTFVGGDIVAGLYACGLLPKRIQGQFIGQQEYGGQTEASLFIDLGTNGEMAVTDGRRMIVTATAAGPAFEGGAGAGIVGSDMIACIASLLRQGILDGSGLLREPFFTEGVSVQIEDGADCHFMSGRKEQCLYMTREDIRALQMAKAAVRAGVEVLLKVLDERREDEQQSDTRHVKRIYLAGGFGYYLDVEAALYIGLLPEHMRGSVTAVGNTSLTGAYLIGRDLWRNKLDRQVLDQSLSSIENINLAQQEYFEQLYIQNMNFPV